MLMTDICRGCLGQVCVQNTNEILSRYLLYEAGDDEASETAESYAARGCKASENSQISEAEMEKASEHRKPMHEEASEIKRTLRAVCKRVEVEETSKYEAMGEEATEMRDSQECILSGGVYLRHRLEKRAFQKICLLSFSHTNTTHQVVKRSHFLAFGIPACWRARSYHLSHWQQKCAILVILT